MKQLPENKTALELSQNFKGFLTKYKSQISEAAGKVLDPDRLAKMMLIMINKPDTRGKKTLLECTPSSLFGAMLECCCYGLYPSVAGHAYMIPYKNKRGQLEANFMLGYKGMIELAYRNKRVEDINGYVIDENDTYELIQGTREELIHRPTLDPSGRICAAYCVVRMRDSQIPHLTFLPVKKIEARRSRSKAASAGPWITDYNAMAKKTAMRAAFTWIPWSVELQGIIHNDEAGERGEQRHNIYESIVGDTGHEETSRAKRLSDKLTEKTPDEISDDVENFLKEETE